MSYFLLLHFCSQRGEGSWNLDTFENVHPNIWHTSIPIEQWNCEWWNGVISGIDAHGNKIWPKWLGDTVRAILSHAAVTGHIGQKVRRRSIVGRGCTGHNLGSYESFSQYVLSHMRPFLFGCHISFCYIFAVKEVRGHEFWTHLKMFIQIFDLLPFLLNNGTVYGGMGS